MIPAIDVPKKWIECEACCHVSQVSKMFPLSLTSCPNCGSIRIRRYWPDRKRKRKATP
jgi:predicted nucleic acid-binding Zn ribbon protein